MHIKKKRGLTLFIPQTGGAGHANYMSLKKEARQTNKNGAYGSAVVVMCVLLGRGG